MSLRIRLILIILFIFALFGADIVANKLYLYWTYSWLDKSMHVLGGFSAAIIGLLWYEYIHRKSSKVWVAIVSAVIVGVAWELMEFIFHISRMGPDFFTDTASDLTMDIIGSIIAYFIWTKLPQQTLQSNNQNETKNN